MYFLLKNGDFPITTLLKVDLRSPVVADRLQVMGWSSKYGPSHPENQGIVHPILLHVILTLFTPQRFNTDAKNGLI